MSSLELPADSRRAMTEMSHTVRGEKKKNIAYSNSVF